MGQGKGEIMTTCAMCSLNEHILLTTEKNTTLLHTLQTWLCMFAITKKLLVIKSVVYSSNQMELWVSDRSNQSSLTNKVEHLDAVA